MQIAASKPSSQRAPAVQAAYDVARRISNRVVIDGQLIAAAATEFIAVENPADFAIIGIAPRCREDDVERAVQAAQRAFPQWAATPPRERGKLVGQAADRLAQEQELLARLLCLETGNALSTQARPELAGMLDILRLFAGFGGEIKGSTVPYDASTLMFTTRDPLGVVGAIIPWNAPLFLMAAKIGPALVAGNTVVLKTAEQAPLAVLHAAEIMQQILPPGVMNVVSGYGEEAGQALARHPQVRKITFTGSVPVGKQILRYAADKICPVTLELGGKSPNIVMPDADLDLVVPGILTGMRFTRQGQSCSAGTRVFLHASVYDTVIERVLREIGKLRVGVPMDEETQVGAMISREQFDRVMHYMELARNTPGTRILCGGGRPADPALQEGLYFAPTLIEGVPHESPLCQEEIFGPVAVVLRWKDFDEVLAQANATEFGLAATLWTRDLNRALTFAERIQAGFVQVNQYATPRANVAYGGLKQSGLGKELTLESMLEHFTSSKTVIINRGTPAP